MDGMQRQIRPETHGLSTAKPPARLVKKTMRLAKIGVALGLAAAGIAAVVSSHGTIASDNAVVSAYTVSVRAPIDGRLSGVRVGVGDMVAPGAVLARIDNERVNDQRLVDLRQSVARSDAEHAAYVQEIGALAEQRDTLLQRASVYGTQASNYMDRHVEEAERQLESKVVGREQARRDLARKSNLARDGYAPIAEAEHLRAGFDIAALDADALGVRLGYLRAQAGASRQGVFLEGGSSDVPYSTQRADEVALRIVETEQAMATVLAARDGAQAQLASEGRRVALLRGAELIAAARGIVWKLGASDGEQLGVGAMVAELVDCRAAFVIASIPQNRFSDVVGGGQARFRLAGETEQRAGRVLGVSGEASVAGDRNLAAAPLTQPSSTATVRVEFTAGRNNAGECEVGRVARVLLPASGGSSWLAWAQRLLP